MAAGGFSPKGIVRVRELIEGHVEAGLVPGMVAVLARRGEVRVEATGTLAFEGPGAGTPMGGDTIVRMASMTKPLAAACAMTLVEDGTVRLDDPIDDLLPELADMAVLADVNGPLDDVVPAKRPITLRDLLTCTLGSGMVPGAVPIAEALSSVRAPSPDEWLRQLGVLPLVYQPGESWLYETGSDVTGVLIARATGMSFEDALRERICGPLGMTDTAFSVGAGRLGRFATAYERDDVAGVAVVEDRPDGRFSQPPRFQSGGGGLVSTADDYLAFATALLAGGALGGERILSPESVALMTTNHVSPAQLALSGFEPGYFDVMGWGFGMAVRTRRPSPGPSVGSYGWSGFYGTAWYNDPVEDMTAIFVMQRAHMGYYRLPMWTDLWAAVYQAIEN